jgi:hypothetical protein
MGVNLHMVKVTKKALVRDMAEHDTVTSEAQDYGADRETEVKRPRLQSNSNHTGEAVEPTFQMWTIQMTEAVTESPYSGTLTRVMIRLDCRLVLLCDPGCGQHV